MPSKYIKKGSKHHPIEHPNPIVQRAMGGIMDNVDEILYVCDNLKGYNEDVIQVRQLARIERIKKHAEAIMYAAYQEVAGHEE